MNKQSELCFDEQERELRRVSGNIATHVLTFVKLRGKGKMFTGRELESMIDSLPIPSTPGSATRILRDLRKKKIIGFEVVNRSQSIYRITHV